MSTKPDLSKLSPEVRRKVEAGLAKLSPEMRRHWEAQGSPLLTKLVSGLAGAQESLRAPPPLPGTPPAPMPPAQALARRTPPHGHYNDTIAPGDRPGLVQRLLLGAAIAGVAAWLFF